MRSQKNAIFVSAFACLLAVPLTSNTAVGEDTTAAQHAHLSGVSCDDIPPNQTRPEFGCFNIASEEGLHFPESEVYWHIFTFENRDAAEAAKSATGIVVEEDGRVWLSEFGSKTLVAKSGHAVANCWTVEATFSQVIYCSSLVRSDASGRPV